MKQYTFLLCLIFISTQILSQDLKPCGTPPYKSDWLKKYQKNPDHYDKRNNEILYVPLAVVLVASDGGSGAMNETEVMKSLCTLNNDYADSEIQFFLGTDIRVIADSDFYTHDDVIIGAEKMFEYNLPNLINCYIVGNASGFCGYNLPYAGVVISQNCAKPTDHTWAHEIGHNLSIQHPFLGWEGGVAHDGSIQHVFSNPAPETVTYDYTYFQDTLILDTLIIDTIQVEKLDGSNCHIAADGFCDTSPDYLAFRWDCDANNMSLGQMTDPNGEKFFSDGTLIMSYAMDECSSRFTTEQTAAMRANLIDEKPTYLDNQNYEEITAESVEYNFPINGEPTYFDKIDLSWEPVENAEFYLVRIAFDEGLNVSLYDKIVYETFVEAQVSSAFSQNTLYWSVAPLNKWNFCPEFLNQETLMTSDVSSISEIYNAPSFRIFPELSQSSGQISVSVENGQLGGRLIIQNIAGQVINELMITEASQTFTAPAEEGLYIATYMYEFSASSKKFIIH